MKKHGGIPSPKNGDHPRRQAKYNNGHFFIWGCGEHPFAQLYGLCAMSRVVGDEMGRVYLATPLDGPCCDSHPIVRTGVPLLMTEGLASLLLNHSRRVGFPTTL